MFKKIPLSSIEKERIAEAYSNDESITSIAERFGISYSYVIRIAKKQGVPLRIPRRFAKYITHKDT